MTTISAQVIEASECRGRKPIYTVLARYPRFIHAELMTHRAFSRNAGSSRAIPVDRLIQDVENDPAVPLFWGRNQPGMQAGDECDTLVRFRHDKVPREAAWLRARDTAVQAAKQFADAGYHKQICNRLLEPFAHINVLITSTEWNNFFALRDHSDAEPHIRLLAQRIREAIWCAPRMQIDRAGWHMPFIDNNDETSEFSISQLLDISAARCARTSYLTHDGKYPDAQKDLALAAKLKSSIPIHASPFEHQARPMGLFEWGRQGNLVGWVQHRKLIENESVPG